MTTAQPIPRVKRPRPETRVIFATVSASERFRPNVQRITFTSAEFDGYICDIPDQFVTFIFPPASGDRRKPAVARDFSWDDWADMPPEEQPQARNYTVRAYEPRQHEILVDMILHDGRSPGMDWALAAVPGDQIALWGPRIAYDPPPDVTWQLLIADDTGLPAAAAILEHMPATMGGHVLIEVASADCIQPLLGPDGVTVEWLSRDGAAAGTVNLLEPAVRALAIPPAVRYAWGGGNHRQMTAIGRYLRREVGFRPVDVTTVGYWSRDGFD